MQMKKIMIGLTLGAAALVSVVSSQAGVSSGLLLGIQEGSAYKTLWIAPQSGKLTVRQGQDVLVPRKSGWWRVASQTHTAKAPGGETSSRQGFLVNPIADKSKGVAPKFEPDCEESTESTLLWVHEKYLALEDSSGGYCKGAAHPWAASVLQVRDLDLVQRGGNTLIITEPEPNLIEPADAISGAAQNQFYQAGISFYARLPKDRQEVFEKEPNITNWALIRREGQWVIRGRLGYAFEAARGECCIDFDTGIAPTAELVGHDKLSIPWKILRANNPKIIDAFSSPKGDLMFLLEPKKLSAFAIQNGKLGALLQTVSFKNSVSPVMIEWANAPSVARWTRDLSKFVK